MGIDIISHRFLQLHPCQFLPLGLLYPITVLYELSYGETELKQVEARRSLHLRLGLPFDRPLLRISNSIDLVGKKNSSNSVQKGVVSASYVHMFNMDVCSCLERSPLCHGLIRFLMLKNVHLEIPSSGGGGGGVSGGVASLVQGSYDYCHYLHEGLDDSGWAVLNALCRQSFHDSSCKITLQLMSRHTG